VTVWTVSAERGAGGTAVAAELARRAGVPLLDLDALTRIAQELDPDVRGREELERMLGDRWEMLGLGLAVSVGSAEAVRTLKVRSALPELARKVLDRAGRAPGVILAPGAFAALAEHPVAIHVRLRGPFAWRVASYQRDYVVDRRHATEAVKHDDKMRRGWVKALYGVDVDDPRPFSLFVDVSRFDRGRIVELLLAAAGRSPAILR
jgi:cytidylate kinase